MSCLGEEVLEYWLEGAWSRYNDSVFALFILVYFCLLSLYFFLQSNLTFCVLQEIERGGLHRSRTEIGRGLVNFLFCFCFIKL